MINDRLSFYAIVYTFSCTIILTSFLSYIQIDGERDELEEEVAEDEEQDNETSNESDENMKRKSKTKQKPRTKRKYCDIPLFLSNSDNSLELKERKRR